MPSHILSIDQGTTSSRAIVFSSGAEILGVAQQEFAQHFPQDGWVEHDPEDIWSTTVNVVNEVLTKTGIAASEIAAIGITNQRETTVVWDKLTGEAIYNAIVWQDRRTAPRCEQLTKDGEASKIKELTGLVTDAYFSAT